MKLFSTSLIISSLLIIIMGQAHAKNGSHEKRERPKRPAFTSIDLNQDGEVSFDEFSQHKIPKGDHETIFAIIDSNDDDVIDEGEFDNHKPARRNKR